MRTLKWNAFLSGLCACALMVGMAGSARADVTIEKGASVITFPYVVWDGQAQTWIQLTNTGNSMLHVACYYVQTEDRFKPVWQETDFDIWLTKQQPTIWPVGPGRQFNPFDDLQGFDVSVPPMGYFIGELKCFEVSPTDSSEPLTGNHLKGEATVVTCDEPVVAVELSGTAADFVKEATCTGAHDVAKYNAIGIEGNPDAQGTNPLQLDGDTYKACPQQLIMNFIADGAEDFLGTLDLDTGLRNNTTTAVAFDNALTLVPCSEDFENQKPTTTTVQFLVYNEFETKFSASTTVDCWLDTYLSDIDSPTLRTNSVFHRHVLGTDVATATITPVAPTNGNAEPVIGVLTTLAHSYHLPMGLPVDNTTGDAWDSEAVPVGTSSAMTNLHSVGDLAAQITLTAH